MKKLSVVLMTLAAFSFDAFAGFEMIYKGKGVWHKTGGETGKYSILVHKTKLSEGMMNVRVSIDLGDAYHSWSSNFVTVEKTAGRKTFKIQDLSGQDIGSGYCYFMESSKVCHMEMTTPDGGKMEKTVHAGLDESHTVGSKTAPDGTVTTWADTSTRIFP